jgi:hypothetical protein
MATGKMILRPYSAVVLSNHKGYPENTALYRWISEEVCDGDETYIYAPAPEGSKNDLVEQISETLVYFEYKVPDKKINIENIKIKYCAKSSKYASSNSKIWFDLTVSSSAEIGTYRTTLESLTEEYPTESSEITIDDDYTQKLNNALSKKSAGSSEKFYFKVSTANGYNYEQEKGSLETITFYTYVDVRLSQFYIEIEYTEILNMGIYKKVAGAVKAARATYRKLGGSWVEITEEEAKGVLKNNIITQGGS